MQNILSEAAMDKLLTLATEAQYQKAASAILVVVIGGASFYLLLPRRKPAVKAEDVLPIPSPPLPQPPPTPSESQFDTDPQPSARHIPTPINTLLTAVGLPGVDTPKITPEDKIVEKAPESYGPLAPGGKGLEIHEDVGKQRVFDGVEAERLAGMEEKEGEKREEEGEGERSSGCSQRGPSRLGRQTAGGELVAPEPEPVMDEEVETDRDEFESMAGDGEDVELGDEKSWLGAFEDEYL